MKLVSCTATKSIGEYVRDCTISLFASPKRRYDRSTEIDVTCPCGSSSAVISSSLTTCNKHKRYGDPNNALYSHLSQNIPYDPPLLIFRDIG